MTIDYSRFKAHPTTYNGIRFRSRLEATWAAFFDGLGWWWEYEPFDLNGWVPDFLVRGESRHTLFEIKPITTLDLDVAYKISESSGHDFNLVVGGVSPLCNVKEGPYFFMKLYGCCMCGVAECKWNERFIVKIKEKYDVVFGHWPDYVGFVTGVNVNVEECSWSHNEYIGQEALPIWNAAKNKTQWRAPR